jgi:hypothetical protein
MKETKHFENYSIRNTVFSNAEEHKEWKKEEEEGRTRWSESRNEQQK